MWQSPDADQKRNIGQEHHDAAEYFHVKNAWHTVAELPTLCENCGEPLPMATVPFHRNMMGLICVRDWKRTVEAGAKTREDVPEEKRWWKEAKKTA